MSITLKKAEITYQNWKVNAFIFLPDDKSALKSSLGLITHGYTSHKGSILSWPTRLAEEGMASILFDLPGHYLGSFNEVANFDQFQKHSFKLFKAAYQLIRTDIQGVDKVFLMGHSLGGFLALKSLENENWEIPVEALVIGLGKSKEEAPTQNIFHSPFFKSVLKIRQQLVSQSLGPMDILSWVRNDIQDLNLTKKKIHLITGMDDIIIGRKGMERLKDHLIDLGNEVTSERPKHLPHHLPELAASFIKSYLKKEKIL